MGAYGQSGYGEGDYGVGPGDATIPGEAFVMNLVFADGEPPPVGEAFSIALNAAEGTAVVRTDIWIPTDLGFVATRWLARGNERYLDKDNWRLGEAELIGIYEDGRLRPIRVVGQWNATTEAVEAMTPGGTL